jgi:hypothetical protein
MPRGRRPHHHGTIEHPFHGRKGDRGYQSRWAMFLDSGFDPVTDLKRNTYGVLEFSGAKPDLERAFDRYLFQRHAGIVADGIAGAQTEARLSKELKGLQA